jgi:hypothetical protein
MHAVFNPFLTQHLFPVLLHVPPLCDLAIANSVSHRDGNAGGLYFDPFGLSRGEPAKYNKMKEAEIRNGRLAMVAMVGFWAQHAATGAGPIQNLIAVSGWIS